MEFLEVPLFDDDFFKLLVRFAFDLAFAILLLSVVYSRRHHTKNFGFTFIVMNIMVFFICFTLKKLELQLGMALGLFAIFSILRYRTDAMKVHDMTYLFVFVGIAVINALSNRKTSYVELLFTNVVIFSVCLLLDQFLFVGQTHSCIILTNRMDLISDDKRRELELFVRESTGLDVKHVQVEKIELKSSKIQLRVFFRGAAQ